MLFPFFLSRTEEDQQEQHLRMRETQQATQKTTRDAMVADQQSRITALLQRQRDKLISFRQVRCFFFLCAHTLTRTPARTHIHTREHTHTRNSMVSNLTIAHHCLAAAAAR